MIVLAAVFGLCIGSFLNVIIWRLPREEGLDGRSLCPHCHHTLAWYDLIPLVSFLLQRGRCRYCQKPVSFRYPLIETIVGFLFAAAMAAFLPHTFVDWLVLIKAAVIIAVCVVVFVIDFEHYLILNKIIFPAAGIAGALLIAQAVASGSPTPVVSAILSAAAPFIIFWLIWFVSGGKWMGYGDVKFVALMGLMLGWPHILVALFAAFIVGAIFGTFLILIGKKQLSSKIPFGTFLSLATVFSLFFGLQMWQWYWNLFQI